MIPTLETLQLQTQPSAMAALQAHTQYQQPSGYHVYRKPRCGDDAYFHSMPAKIVQTFVLIANEFAITMANTIKIPTYMQSTGSKKPFRYHQKCPHQLRSLISF
jgi:hypothetical protein